ncbi:MAG: glycosyltransferase family 4 protein [Chloroflexi bacterium]|nr:glycosyltransferase family 4 protein [Chloroflexota bacterium]
MNILMLNHNVVWRSTFYRCYHFAKELVRRGHDVTVVSISPSRRFGSTVSTLAGVTIVEMPDLLWGMGRTGWDPWNTANRLRYVYRHRFDLVHGFDCRPVVIFPSLAAAAWSRAPFVSDWADWWGRGGAISERRNWFLRGPFGHVETMFEERFRPWARGLTVISTALAERARGLGIPAERILHLPGGADVDTWRPIPIADARRRVGIPVECPVVGFFGFVHYDLGLVLRTFAEVRSRLPAARLLLTGPKSPLTRRFGGELGILDAIDERGIVPYEDVPLYIAAADVCLLPFANKTANRGRWPNKLGDYLAMGRPIVSNPVGDIRPLFEDHQVGQLAPEEPGAMAAAAVRLLEDPSQAAAMGVRARAVAEDHLSYRTLAQRLEAFYVALCQSDVVAGPLPGGGAEWRRPSLGQTRPK